MTNSDTLPDEPLSKGHTPGPWDCTGAKFPDDDMGGVYYRIEADGMDMRAANARLIAAAPDLLAVACEMLPRNLCLTNPNIGDDTVIPLDVTMGDLRKIAAAISRARGES